MCHQIKEQNPLQDIECALSLSKLPPHKKRLLFEILATIDMPDIRQQAFDNLFNQHTEKQDVSPFSIKSMMMNLTVLFNKEEVRKHIPSWQMKDYLANIQALYNFSDTLDDDAFYLLRKIEDLANFGEAEKTHEDYHTVEYLHDLMFKKRSLKFAPNEGTEVIS
ncbi:MAG TPA: hypothetical protein VNI52_03075 [Sphingobacteriaceae bacterium]|nr:hypothetical protein [Sphingobacteriaceae bacterium]